MNNIYKENKKSYFSQSKSLEMRLSRSKLQTLGSLLALSSSRLGMWEAASLRQLHVARFSSFVGAENITSFNPSQQGVEGVLVLLVRKSKHGVTKDFVCSQVRAFGGSMAATVRTNTATKLKSGTNTLFIFATMVYLNHSQVFLILDEWIIVGVLHL